MVEQAAGPHFEDRRRRRSHRSHDKGQDEVVRACRDEAPHPGAVDWPNMGENGEPLRNPRVLDNGSVEIDLSVLPPEPGAALSAELDSLRQQLPGPVLAPTGHGGCPQHLGRQEPLVRVAASRTTA